MTPAYLLSESRLDALHRASLSIASADSLDDTLQQIVDSACELIGAAYGAIGISSAANLLKTFVFSGLNDEDANEMAHLPVGLGLLGAVIEEKRPIRIPKISDDPRSVGFPAGHPPMDSFLGVPIISEGVVLGNLYLTSKLDAFEFSAQDQKLVEMLAAHAAVAIRKTMLLQASRQHSTQLEIRNDQLTSLNEAMLLVTGELSLDKVLQEIVNAARHLVPSHQAVMLIVNGDGVLESFICSNATGDQYNEIDSWPDEFLFLRDVVREQRPLVQLDGYRLSNFSPVDHILAVPLAAGGEMFGHLYLTQKISGTEYTSSDQELLEMLMAHAVVIIQNTRLYEQIGRLAVVEERARIGMDLHDGVIQSIYAVGLILESARLGLQDKPEESDSLMVHAIEELNDTIRDIRNFILDLRPHRFSGNLSQGIARLVREFQANTMTSVNLQVHPDMSSHLSTPAARALFLTTQEALANIARHARATEVVITVQCEQEWIELLIKDNGRGFDSAAQTQAVGHGLSNMRARAEELKGSFVIDSTLGKGTRVTLRLPCDECVD